MRFTPSHARAVGLAAALTLGFSVQYARADFEAGKLAYDGGDYITAFDEWERASKAGDPLAQHWLAKLYERGKGVPKNIPKAIILYREAAENGHPWAMAWLARLYNDGRHAERDSRKAFLWATLALERGLAESDMQHILNTLASQIPPDERRRIKREIRKRYPKPTWTSPDDRRE